MTNPPLSSATSCPVAVIMERVALANRWITEKWEAKGVVRDMAPREARSRSSSREEKLTQVLFPGHVIRLQRDEAEGYYLNITSPQPKVFVLWRLHDEVARPEFISVSYNEGTRWADSGENVDGVPAPGRTAAVDRRIRRAELQAGAGKEKALCEQQRQGPHGQIRVMQR